MTDSTAAAIPDGFSLHTRRSGLTAPWEPIYARRLPDSVFLGLMAGPAHANGRGLVHGGLITALADNAMGLACVAVLEARHGSGAVSGLVTVNLAVDFLGAAQQGRWLEIRPAVVKTGGTLCFARADILSDEILCAQAHATFKTATR